MWYNAPLAALSREHERFWEEPHMAELHKRLPLLGLLASTGFVLLIVAGVIA